MATDNKNDNRRIFYLNEVDNLKVHHDDPDVTGWDIYSSDNVKIGEVENLIIDKEAKRVRYLDVHLEDEFLKGKPLETKGPGEAGKIHEHINEDGHRHLIIPIGVVDIDEDDKNVRMNSYSRKDIIGVPRYDKKKGINNNYELKVRQKMLPAKYHDQPEKEYYENEYYIYRDRKNNS